ncbi:hypothetical protein PHYBLDRAFT_163537 [Phycomyces blakesleeanus NRRL 1555(-)]|uniref:Uncharacterized protein n=1 Tax=Phycomyces blakesleeanus (strain ATCC 8743b / DSM 1359 / FGSC 10004 / NBRC 33097 / NRRL 1555) TaxID=763407 RepID=A0A162Y5L5_PHYB8|nr:hypothetical protein PHYBLDRAFT_163537 [Phycomyces blakesleeanus NRRL 1555(-)]OAD78425.1 hypothetical protein PHYBLDRAFT_163537 [Phycomyces blakesleeanus NRRL 1555(-)]|eukprot:XP_018296465.1 hypothetical protein PHYBLDRAFT_163537 [Phycomyces blakesleeanus NRRL 1555(-)]
MLLLVYNALLMIFLFLLNIPSYSKKVASEFLYMKAGVAQVLSESHIPCLQCIDNGYHPAFPFGLPMFQQVVNSLWYNVIGTKASPPTTMPLKLQHLNTMNISLGENVLVNICIQKMKNISLLGQEFFSEQKKCRSSIVRLTTSPNSLVRLNTYLLVIKIGRIKSVNVWFFKKICDAILSELSVIWIRSEFVVNSIINEYFYQNKLTESDITISNEKNRG